MFGEVLVLAIRIFDSMLISVVIPWRDAPLTEIWSALDSIKRQTTELAIETTIVNDGSEPVAVDKLRSSLTSFSSANRHFQLISTPVASGIAAARNLGIKYSQGSYFVWLDADDQLEISAIAKLHNAMRMTGADVLVGDCVVLSSIGQERRHSALYVCSLHKEFLGTPYDPWHTVVFAIHPQLLSREIVEFVGGFDESYEWAEMTEFFLRVLHAVGADGVHHIAEPLYRYSRMHPNAHSSHRNKLEYYRQKALLAQARRAGYDLDEVMYAGRESTTGAQHFVPRYNGDALWPPYLVQRSLEHRLPIVELLERYLNKPHGEG